MNQEQYEPVVLFQLMGFHPDPNDPREYYYAFEDFAPADWAAFKKRLITHPREASFQRYCTFFQRELQYPLHCALHIADRPIPPDVLTQLIRANPDALHSKGLDRIAFHMFVNTKISLESIQILLNASPSLASTMLHDKKLPLHIASFECSKLLISLYPQALSTPDVMGCIPLWNAVRFQSPGHVKLFLEEGMKYHVGANENGAGGLFMKNNFGGTCFELALQKAINEIRMRPHTFRIPNYFEKFCVCLQAVTVSNLIEHGKSIDSIFSNHFILHAAIEFGRDYSLIERACQRYPENITTLDPFNRTALSICLENWEYIDFSSKSSDSTESDKLKNKRNLISILCVEKMCSYPDFNGDLPLTQYVMKSHQYNPDIIHDIISTEPRQLETRQMKTHLYPFLSAAVVRTENEEGASAQLNKIFHLLLANPAILGNLCNH